MLKDYYNSKLLNQNTLDEIAALVLGIPGNAKRLTYS